MALTPPGGIPRTTDDIDFTGAVRVNAGSSGFSIADPTDATKKLIFDCSALSGTATFVVPSGAGTEVTTDGTQTLTNKTLLDTSTTIANTSSTTKRFQFLASGVTAGQTRILTVPDFNGTIATLAGTETFTNKTLTSPTINAATLTGSISGGTVAPTTLTVPASTALTTPALTAPTVTTSLVVTSTTGGVVFPNMTTTQRDAIATPAKGTVIYNTSTDAMNYYDGAWQAFAKV